jgi:hypothetical protein
MTGFVAIASPMLGACDNEDMRDVEEGVNDAERGVEDAVDEADDAIDKADTDGKDD